MSRGGILSYVRFASRKLRGAVAVVGAVALSVGGVAIGAAGAGTSHKARATSTTAYVRSLYKEALAHGEHQVVIYQAAAPAFAPLIGLFNKAFPGITANAESIIGAAATAKLQAEFSSGQHVADVVQSGLSDLIPDNGNGWLVSYLPADAKALPRGLRGSHNDFLDSSAQLYSIIYNKNYVKSAQAPKSWAALLSPRWKGKVGVEDPTASNGSSQAFAVAMAHKVWGPAQLKKLKANSAELYSTEADLVSAVATGQVEIGVLVSFDQYKAAVRNGAPIAYGGKLKEGNVFLPLAMGIVKHAPDSYAAMLYEAWFFSPPVQKAVASLIGQYGTIPGSPTPSGAPSLSSVTVLAPPLGSKFISGFNNEVNVAKRIFG